MQALKRYFVLAVTLVLLLLVYLTLITLKRKGYLLQNHGISVTEFSQPSVDDERCYTTQNHGALQDIRSFDKIYQAQTQKNDKVQQVIDKKSYMSKTDEISYPGVEASRNCSMETCFDFKLCAKGFKVYVYPQTVSAVSYTYRAVLSSILESRFFTMEASEACIFVLAIDTLERDVLGSNYVNNIPEVLRNLQPWTSMGGKNHVIFNMYSGTWPDYTEDLGFDFGQAILAKASVPIHLFRYGFDISLPLFAKEHPHKGGERGQASAMPVSSPKYLLTFKGKRYLKGKGSDARNSLHHIHNNGDIVLLTTCRHGKNWKTMADERCDDDNKAYDRYDFKKLLQNSTFCLVPRGRRLGSYRFLEALQMGCIPVLVSNDWPLPFNHHIDWNKAVIWADERLLLQIPSIVRSITKSHILSLRQQTQFLWETYFSSIDKIIHSTLLILHDRIMPHLANSRYVWNNAPGALVIHPHYSDTLTKYPFFYRQQQRTPGAKFTAVIYATTPVLFSSSPLFRLLRTVLKSSFVKTVVIVWHCDAIPPVKRLWPSSPAVPVVVITKHSQTISARFYPYKVIDTDAVLSLDEDALLNVDEMDFAFSVWREFPERIVGFPCRNHVWNEAKSRWSYTSKWTNHYSMVLTGAAFYHRYYNHVYSFSLSPLLTQVVDQSQNCEDILMNFVVSHITKVPPIKVTQRRAYKESLLPAKNPRFDTDRLIQRDHCLNSFFSTFGYMPLVRSAVRLDTMLYKDSVSNLRKKYRQIEVVV